MEKKKDHFISGSPVALGCLLSLQPGNVPVSRHCFRVEGRTWKSDQEGWRRFLESSNYGSRDWKTVKIVSRIGVITSKMVSSFKVCKNGFSGFIRHFDCFHVTSCRFRKNGVINQVRDSLPRRFHLQIQGFRFGGCRFILVFAKHSGPEVLQVFSTHFLSFVIRNFYHSFQHCLKSCLSDTPP